jgi:signal transduction histidine kinase
MRSALDGGSALGRALARIDVRLALLVSGLTAAFTLSLVCGLLAYAVREAFEEQFAVLDETVALLDMPRADGIGLGALRAGIAYRVLDDAGRERAASGPWPPPAALRERATMTAALGARPSDSALRRRASSDGGTIEAALSLQHFVGERRELAVGAAAVLVVGLVGSLGLGIGAARRALRPLRDTTAAIRAIDPRRLEERIPLRGTNDDVDRLAEATNVVLERLEAAFARMASFSADVAHELRTPVNRVLNAAEVALTTTTSAAAQQTALASIYGTAESMRRTIEQLLLLASGEEGRLRLEHESVDLSAIVDGLAQLYAPLAERLQKTLSCACEPVLLEVDRALVERAVANLIENALVHGRAGAEVRVCVRQLDGHAVVAVEDSGPGIAAGDRERVFNRFVRLDAARARGGAGLGLPIARMVARLHGGDLVLTSSRLGGAAFLLNLPSTGRAAQAAHPPEADGARATQVA